ncbi:glycosyltransferase [Paenibacillus sp. y28]|uniref:glycosyltransferase n=1 Tax=Paenibacillus sp. y28 TaxID=3129110 RepID=UPI0030171B7F
MLISVCMIVKNEAANVQRALNSIPPSFEKVVVDTGSTDDTVKIAERMGAKVGYFEWTNDFAAARNHSVRLATGQYILILDADEELAEDAESRLHSFIAKYPDKAGSVTIESTVKGECHQHQMLRWFPNNGLFAFQGIVHEHVVKNGQEADFEQTGLRVIHHGYQEEMYKDGAKADRYLKLYENHLKLHPEDGYMLYQLGKLHYSMGELHQAADAFDRCLTANERERLYFPVMLVMLGYVLKELGHSGLAEELLEPFTYEYPAFPDLFFLLGLLAMDTGKVRNIESRFQQALQIGETTQYTSVKGVGSFKAAYNLGIYYELTGNPAQATRYYKESASAGYAPAAARLQSL